MEQFSVIFNYFNQYAKNGKGTVRQLIWHKTNPSPMNGQNIYLSSTENAVWFKKRGSSFNAHCKHNVFNYPCGRSKLHPTEKNHDLIKDLILDNSNEGDLIFDPCVGSGSHLLCAKELNRNYIGCELDKKYFKIAKDRLDN
jgi:DNA modification methylase